MLNEQKDRRDHTREVFIPVFVALIVGVFSSYFTSVATLAALETEIINVKDDVFKLSDATEKLYTTSKLLAEQAILIEHNSRRLDIIEKSRYTDADAKLMEYKLVTHIDEEIKIAVEEMKERLQNEKTF